MKSDSLRIVIVGAGGQGAVVADALQQCGSNVIGFIDDTTSLQGTSLLGLPIFGPIDSLPRIEHDAVIVAIGDNGQRRRLTESLLAKGEHFATAIHPFSSIAPSAVIGEGSMISAGAVVQPRAVLGRGVLINTRSSVDHDSVIGDFAHISPGVTIGAKVQIGAETLIAMGATVVSDMRVGSGAIVGAGAVVVSEIADGLTAMGVPARVRSRNG
jgi:sugar O-acyltransferase (sialic acid O-acetyltransferase NeuD family)